MKKKLIDIHSKLFLLFLFVYFLICVPIYIILVLCGENAGFVVGTTCIMAAVYSVYWKIMQFLSRKFAFDTRTERVEAVLVLMFGMYIAVAALVKAL